MYPIHKTLTFFGPYFREPKAAQEATSHAANPEPASAGQQSRSSAFYEMSQQYLRYAPEDHGIVMECLVAAVQEKEPDPRALCEASKNPHYAALYNELPCKDGYKSPEQCFALAVESIHLDAALQFLQSTPGDPGIAVKILVAVQEVKPNPGALYEASKNPHYAALYNELPCKDGYKSPEQCFALAVEAKYPEAILQVAVAKFGTPVNTRTLKSIEQFRHSAAQTALLKEIKELAFQGCLQAITIHAQFFSSMYTNSPVNLININKHLLRQVKVKTCEGKIDKTSYLEALREVAKIYDDFVTNSPFDDHFCSKEEFRSERDSLLGIASHEEAELLKRSKVGLT